MYSFTNLAHQNHQHNRKSHHLQNGKETILIHLDNGIVGTDHRIFYL